MKKIYFILVFVIIFVMNKVQSQIVIVDGITYQAVVVDENGKEIAGMDINGIIVPEKAVNVRFTILAGSSSGNIEYQETQVVNTDVTGLFSCVIGQGQPTSNSPTTSILSLSFIADNYSKWGLDKHFLKVEIDIKGTGEYILTGTEQMQAVPYAFWALGYHELDPKWSGLPDLTGDIGRIGNVGIGDTIPTQKLDVNGQIRIRGGSPANTKFLISSFDGTANWDSIRNVVTSGTGLSWNGNTLNSVWTKSVNDIFNNNSGNVGIGSISPAAKLDVDGGHTLLQNSSNDINLYLKTKTAGTYLSNLFFQNSTGTGYGGISGDQTNSRVNIWMGATPAGNEKVTVLSSGEIGIGTVSPNVSVHINATDAIAIPTGTNAQQPVTPPTGSMRFNTTLGVLEVFNGTCWQNANTPPIGSTYIQWYGAADPNTIYPCTQWTSSDIATGEFIRATGGLSNVSAPPLTGVVQNFATEDHEHNSTGSVGNSITQTTSSDGSHNHGGSTTGVNSFSTSTWIPYDDNTTDNLVNGSGSGASSVCGGSWNQIRTGGNFIGQFNQSCLDHAHGINSVVDHSHTIIPHNHPLTLSVGNISTGNSSTETRPTNVAVVFWRRIL